MKTIILFVHRQNYVSLDMVSYPFPYWQELLVIFPC